MKKGNVALEINAGVIAGPRGLSIKSLKYKETSSNGDNVYEVIREDENVIGEVIAKRGIQGIKGDVGNEGNDGRGIVSLLKRDKQGPVTTYEFTYTDGTIDRFMVEDGENAYEVAVDNGFEGTEKEWLLSLIGSSGPQGEKGEQGVEGIGISEISFKEDLSNGDKVYTITLANGKTYDFTAPMGPKGSPPDLEALKKEIEKKASKDGDTMTGNLIVKSPTLDGYSTVLYNEGFIDLNRKLAPPVVRFFNNEGSAYVGRYGDGINALNIGNGVSGAFYRIYDNGIHEFLLPSTSAMMNITGQGYLRDTVVRITSSNTGTYSGKLEFDNTYHGTRKGISVMPNNHTQFIFSNERSAQFPADFTFRNNAGTTSTVNLINLNANVVTLNNTYFNRTTGGTIIGGTDIQGAFSANSFYSRGTITSAGNIISSGNVTAYSDIKLKENIKPLKNSLELIDRLEVVHYDWKDNGKSDIGVIAQEVEKVFPEFVLEIQDDINGTVKTVDYSKLAVVSLQGIKELLNIIENMKNDINRLKEGK